MISKTYKFPKATQKTAMFNDISKTVHVFTVILSQNWSLSQYGALRPLGVFIATNSPWSIKLFSALPACCLLCRMPFSNVVCMRTCSLVPKPKTTVIGLGVRLVHTWNRELSRHRTVGMVVVVAKAYAVGKALHLAVYFIAMLRNSLLAALVMLRWSCSCLSTVVSFMWKKIRKSAAQRKVQRVGGPSSASSLQIMLPICILLVVRNSKLVFKLGFGAECHVSFYSLYNNHIGTAGGESLGNALKECTKLEHLEWVQS